MNNNNSSYSFIRKLSPQTRGNICIIAGVLLFVNAIGLVPSLNAILVVIAVALLWYGLDEAGHINKVSQLIRKRMQ